MEAKNLLSKIDNEVMHLLHGEVKIYYADDYGIDFFGIQMLLREKANDKEIKIIDEKWMISTTLMKL